jgi:putative ABC transport system permease protein
MIGEYFRLAIKNLSKRRLRSFLTLIGILISIATIFVLISLSLGLNASIQDQFKQLGSDKFFIQPRGQFGPPGSTSTGSELTQKDLDIIKKVSGVKDVSFYTVGNAKVKFKDQIRFTMVAGVDMDSPQLVFSVLKIDEGRLIEKKDIEKILIGSQYKNNKYVGTQVAVRDTLEINDQPFKVVGILQTQGNPADDRLIYMPIDEFRTLFNITERIDAIVVQVDEGADIKTVADAVKKKLMKSRDVTEKTMDFTVLTPEEVLAAFGTILNIVTVFLFGIASISLLVGGINIANTMFTSVLERTREIGVMKAIGAKNSDILYIFMIEAGLLGLVGGLVGVILGFGLSKAIEYIAVTMLATTLLQTSTPLYLFAGCLLFAFLAGGVSGFWPAWNATRIKPVDALRYE